MRWLSDWFPENASTFGPDIDGLFTVIYWMTTVAFLLVMVLMAVFLVAYRGRPGRKAVYSHGNTALEVVWTLVPAVLLVWLTFKSQDIWEKVRGPMPAGDVHIGVSGKQYNWFFYYPGPDGALGKVTQAGRYDAGDNVEATVLDVPVDKVIRLSISSQDVIHSFFLPNMRLKQDAVPGRSIEVWFQATRPGQYEVACAELCGFGHSTMRTTMIVHDEASWAAWLSEHPNAFPGQNVVAPKAEEVANHE